jgi:putative peptidoglycan lipid II flippase
LDFRGSGLGHTLRLGLWTVLFVIVNQVAYAVVVRLASRGTVGGHTDGAGYTIYANSFLLTQVPHSIITVSLATAMLPLLSRYAAEQDLRAIGRSVSSTIRSAYALIVPAAAFLAVMARDIAHVVWGYGSAAADFGTFAPTLALFGLGLVLFTMHYLVLRGFYALEQNRRVFYIQCAVSATNIVVALLLVPGASVEEVAPRLVLAYACSYAVGATLSYTLLAREVGGLAGRVLVRFLVRLAIAVGVSAVVALAIRNGLVDWVPGAGRLHAVLDLVLAGAVFTSAYLGLARMLRLTEVNDVMALVTRRLPGRH